MPFRTLKLHFRTTILISMVLIAVCLLMGYFSTLAIGGLNDRQESQQAQLIATRIAEAVEHHIKREWRKLEAPRGERLRDIESPRVPDWAEATEEILETIVKANPELTTVRVFQRTDDDEWEEAVRLPADAGDASEGEVRKATRLLAASEIASITEDGRIRSIRAVAPVISPRDTGPATQIATASVVLAFDESQSALATIRGLLWPLMFVAIISVTLITYFLFRHIVYKPVEKLLAAMSRAEAGDLRAEVAPTSSDEIGLLTTQFNRMLARIREMTEHLNLDQRRLEDRVREATAEIAERSEQLEEANLRLFEIQRQMTQLERTAAAGQLAAQFAHEVGTPLNLISGHVQLLRARAVEEPTIKRLNIIAGQIGRITDIVRSMLDSTRRPSPKPEPADLNSILAQVLDATQPTLAARNVAVNVDMADHLPAVLVDHDQFQQVLLNLINNSLEAMPHGGEIRVATCAGSCHLLVQISDTGSGIADEQIDFIFNPFFTTKEGRGTGLGLTIVKQIISEHGGKISVKSGHGMGTTFLIELPLSLQPTSGGDEPAYELQQSGIQELR